MARQKLFIRDNEETLWERVARYAAKRGIDHTQAKDQLIRLGLFVSSVPFGSTLYRRSNDPILDGWSTEKPDAAKYPAEYNQYNDSKAKVEVEDPLF